MRANGRIHFSETAREERPNHFVRDLIWSGGTLAEVPFEIMRREGNDDRRDVLPVGAVVTLGPYRVRVVRSTDWGGSCYLVTRTGFDSYLIEQALRLLAIGRQVNARLLMTCQVWGLMPWTYLGDEPRWRDMVLVRAVTGWWRAVQRKG